MAEKTVAEQVEGHLRRWNKPPSDRGTEFVVGTHVDPGDTRATGHVPVEERNAHITAGNTAREAARRGESEESAETPDSDDYNDWTNKQLKAEIDRRNEDRDDDDRLSKSGKHDDLVALLEEDDDADND